MFFHLYEMKASGALKNSMADAWLSDSNFELINCYYTVRDKINPLVELLAEYKRKHCRKFYYELRDQNPKQMSDLERAARFIYLNKTCYNGLYRVNSKGQFNVPIGTYRDPAVLDAEKLVKANLALRGTNIASQGFEHVLDYAKTGDFVYFDPPYHPLNETSNFSHYTEQKFGEKEQENLANAVRELTRRGCMVMLSNSASHFVGNLYAGFRIEEVLAGRAINSDGAKRGKIFELVILNY